MNEHADLLIAFTRRVHCRHLWGDQFELWVSDRESSSLPKCFSGRNLKALLDDRSTIVILPLQFARDGREVIIFCDTDLLPTEEWGRCPAESFRDLVRRSIRLRTDA